MQGCSKGKRPITDLFLPLRMTKSHRSCRRRLAVISLVKKNAHHHHHHHHHHQIL